MQIARVLAGSAAAAVMVLVPQAAFAADGDYGTAAVAVAAWATEAGSVGDGGGSVGAGSWLAAAQPTPRADCPPPARAPLDTAIAGAGLLLLVGGGAVVVASRRKELETA